ncbi:MAG: PRC-barrel domain-containing protein [Candidatus Peribacteraceae bacterium]|nr:PRC-barrel domain-containing protein [Candidatus Peribacteraceae bacterium]
MHVRFSTCLGLPVTDESVEIVYGRISGILLHPDTGKVEGFYVAIPRFLGEETLFLSSNDILRWGRRVTVRSGEVLAPPEEFFRLRTLLEDGRKILHQLIRTESGRRLGRCRDVQFNTEAMHLEWLFPRRWWRWSLPLPASDIVEVRPDAIVVRDPPVPVAEKEKEGVVQPGILPVLPETV